MGTLKPEIILRQSIIDQLNEEILCIQSFWESKGSAAFIRIEGGIHRKLFISTNIAVLNNSQVNTSPFQSINWLSTSERMKSSLIEVFERLLPGTCLIVHDSDTDSENRIVDWFIASI